MPARKILFSALLCVLFLWVFSCFFASSCLAAFSFSISKVTPTTITSKDQEVSVTLDIDSLPSESYFRVAWKKGNDSGSYFGYIKDNDGNWTEIESLSSNNCSKYYKVSQAGSSQITLMTKIGSEENIEQESYLLRAHRFTTTSCSGTSSTNSTTVQVQLASTPSNPSSPPSPSPSPPNLPNQPYPANIYLSEFMACPSEGNEWVEIYNDNDSSVNLSDWLIRDSTDGKNQSFSTDIGGKSYHKIDISGYLLNNSGDSVRLLSPGSEVDSHAYSECDSSYTWSKVNGSWCKTDQSPGNNNNSCKEESSQDSNSSPSPSSTAKKASAKPSAKPSSPPKTTAKPNKNTKPSSNPDQSEINLMEYADVLGEQDENKEEKEENKSLFQSKLFFPIILSLSGLLFITASLYPKIRPKILKILGKK